MKEDVKEELKEEGENNESFIGALIAKFRERDDSGDDERDAFTIIEQEEDAFSKTTKTLTQKRTDGTNATKKKKKNEKENVKAMIDRSFWWREDEETENEDDCRRSHRLSHQPHTDRQNHPLNHQNWEEEEEEEKEEKQRKRSLLFVDAAAGFAEKEEEEDADVDILEVWRRRRRENELMNTTTTTNVGGGGGARTTSSFYDTNQYRRGSSFNDDNSAMMFSHHRHRSNDDANKVVDTVTNKSAQTSFFREDPFVSVGTRKEERGRGKRRKGRSTKSEPTIAKSKNGRVLISAANITDESDEDFSDDANTTTTSSVEYDSKEEEDDDDDDDEIDEEQIRLEKRLDAIKARLKKFGIS
jgi:hypothetical protein